MAEDFGDKTEAATPRRRQEAREEGNVARSPDLVAALLLVGMFVLLNFYGSNLVKVLQAVVRQMLSADSIADYDLSKLGHASVQAILLVAAAMAPVFIGVLVI